MMASPSPSFAPTLPAVLAQVRGESAAQDLVNVLGVLEGAPELRDLLQRVERDLNRYAGGLARGRAGQLCGWAD